MNIAGTITNEDFVIKNHPVYGEVRAALFNNEVLVVAIDLARAIGYVNPKKAIHAYIPDKYKTYLRAPIGKHNESRVVAFLSEAGIYQLLFRSKLPHAEKLRQWLSEDVLPTFRKTRHYDISEKEKSFLDTTVDFLQVTEENERIKHELAYCNNKIEQLIMSAGVGELFNTSDDCCTVSAFAKFLYDAGYPFGRKRLYAWLQKHGYIMKPRYDSNCPTQWAVEKHYMKIRAFPNKNLYSKPRFCHRPVITPTGANRIYLEIRKEYENRQKILDKLDKDGYIVLEEADGSDAERRRIEFEIRHNKGAVNL